MKKIEITKHNTNWSLRFKKEALNLKSSLGNNCINIYHIGSTAVPGLYAKPKIDIIAEVHSLTDSHLPLQEIGYEYRGEFNIPMRHFFRKKKPHDINLHIYEKDNPDIKLNILFRDFLINSSEATAEYNKLKLSLLKNNKSHIKENSIFTGYNLGKDKFIRKILDKLGYDGLSFRFCTHHAEWDAYHEIARDLFKSRKIQYNSNHSNFSDSNYYHFILSKGTQIIAISELKWGKEIKPSIKYLHSSAFQNSQTLEIHLRNLITRWIDSNQSTLIK